MKHALRLAVDKLREKGEGTIAEKLLAVYARTKRPKVESKKRKEEKSRARRGSIAEIRAAVWERSGGRCENIGECLFLFESNPWDGELDHWMGGSGRRRSEQSMKNCWRLCWGCHRARTTNMPSVAYWNDRWKAHCERYGYAFAPHVEHAKAAREARTANTRGI